jgi:hypothetical protein
MTKHLMLDIFPINVGLRQLSIYPSSFLSFSLLLSASYPVGSFWTIETNVFPLVRNPPNDVTLLNAIGYKFDATHKATAG